MVLASLSGSMGCGESGDVAAGQAVGEGKGEGEGEGEAPCSAPGAPGNSKGVGEYCTPGGQECADNAEAFVCVVDIRPDANPICVMTCSSHAACGEEAYCTGEDGSGPKGCVPACMLDIAPPDPGAPDDPEGAEGQ